MSHGLPFDFASGMQRQTMEIAVLDLGSTTFHLQHIRVDGAGQFSTCLDEKRSNCLGAQVFSAGFLDHRAWLNGMTSVDELLELSQTRHPDHLAIVATSAIRSASNGARFAEEIERRRKVAVRILDPSDEARLAYLGQSTSPCVGGRRVAVVDLGGGSVELAVGEGVRCLRAASLPIGAVRMRATHGGERFLKADMTRVVRGVRQAAAAELAVVRELSPEIVVFGSGSARAARKLLMRTTNLPGKLGPVDVPEFRVQLNALTGYLPEHLLELGVEPARAPTVLVAATIMLELLDMLGAHQALVSDKGLRDGVALEVYRDLVVQRRAAANDVAVA